MKSLLNKIFKNRLAILLRNTLNVFPVRVNKYYLNKNISISDAFLFRTDNNFKTIFRFTDLPNFLYSYKNTSIDLIFFDYKGILLKEINIDKMDIHNEIVIDKNFFQGLETYGHFYLFHNIPDIGDKKIILSNRCYLGFSKNDNSYSYVHGNSYVKSKDFNTNVQNTDFSNMSLLMNSKYIPQENFIDYDKIELFFANPTSRTIRLEVNKKEKKLLKNCDIKFELNKIKKVAILSNCKNIRPIVFVYKDGFYDVHHC
ncbi:hypothetical protein N9518_03455 [Candidatus Pelagibacter sp.]|jgi:hypothetical protein|nr:hypothetical protein [Candidatus Pelagibacter sp.]